MRWIKGRPDQKRVVKRFLFIPTCLNGETRWLETAFIWQRFWFIYWHDECWTTKEDYLKLREIHQGK